MGAGLLLSVPRKTIWSHHEKKSIADDDGRRTTTDDGQRRTTDDDGRTTDDDDFSTCFYELYWFLNDSLMTLFFFIEIIECHQK